MFVKWETHVCSLSLVLDSERKTLQRKFRTRNKPQNTLWNVTDIHVCKKRNASAQTIIL